MKKFNYYKNIYVNYLFTFTKSLNVTQGIWMLYLASKGLSLFEIGLLEGIFHATSLLMETPTGAIADIFGRKTSRLIGVVLAVLASVLMITSNSFLGFAISFVVTALSYNFESGANEALVYDSLLLENKQSRYMKIAGRTEVVYQATSIIALIIGGAIGNIQYAYVYYLAIALSVISIGVGLFFKEPKMAQAKEKVGLGRAMKKQYVDSFKAIRGSSRLTYLILLTAVFCASVTLTFFYMQLAWKDGELSTLTIGIYLAASALAAALGALVAAWLEKRFGEKLILKVAPVIIAITIVLLYFTKFALIPFCIMNFAEAIIFVATRDYINKTIGSEQRATILSFESLMFSLVMILLFPAFGFVSDLIGMRYTFAILGGLMLVMAAVNLKLKFNGTSSE
ncbi:MAG: MFS transporter [Clostridia bacterium]|jgi:MFS family permease|nr:MFS transporter [Clostridia bacterium]